MVSTSSVSVVIATLGGEGLEVTIGDLELLGNFITEVIVCIPENRTLKAELPPNPLIKVLHSPKAGQVAQRAHALRKAVGDVVVQLDDDVRFSAVDFNEAINKLVQMGEGNALAPIFFNESTNAPLTRYSNSLSGLVKSVLATLLGAAPWGWRRMGKVDRSGIPYALDARYLKSEALVQVDWVPGGFVACHKQDLVTDDYYPFTGKAYSEDVIHSLLWRKNRVKLWVKPDFYVRTSIATAPANWKSIKSEYEARRYVTKLSSGDLWRCDAWRIYFSIRLIISRIISYSKKVIRL